MHPLTSNLSQLKDEELNKQYGELSRRLSQCYRFGPTQVIPQLQMLMQDYQDEINRRQAKIQQELADKLDKSGKGFKGIIDIQ
jgi:hypothetical protein